MKIKTNWEKGLWLASLGPGIRRFLRWSRSPEKSYLSGVDASHKFEPFSSIPGMNGLRTLAFSWPRA